MTSEREFLSFFVGLSLGMLFAGGLTLIMRAMFKSNDIVLIMLAGVLLGVGTVLTLLFSIALRLTSK